MKNALDTTIIAFTIQTVKIIKCNFPFSIWMRAMRLRIIRQTILLKKGWLYMLTFFILKPLLFASKGFCKMFLCWFCTRLTGSHGQLRIFLHCALSLRQYTNIFLSDSSGKDTLRRVSYEGWDYIAQWSTFLYTGTEIKYGLKRSIE